VTAYLFEAEFVPAGLARVVNPILAMFIHANARPDVLASTLGHLMVRRNQGDARKLLFVGVLPVWQFPWLGNGPDESLPLLSIPYHPGLIARISDWCSLT
jgi:hypothetical protein